MKCISRRLTPDRRETLNVLSEVICNRPRPLREFDQIFMKAEDIVAQAILIGRKFNHLKAVFIGDGDSIALAIVHLSERGLLAEAPDHIRVLDFDQRIVNAINRFAELHGYSQIIVAELYNVVDPLPRTLIGQADAFYTNPPWGASNGGESVVAFLRRDIEAVGDHGLAAVVVPNEPRVPWTQEVLRRTKSALAESDLSSIRLGRNGVTIISTMIPICARARCSPSVSRKDRKGSPGGN